MMASQEEAKYARTEFGKYFIEDDALKRLCFQLAAEFMPDGAKAAALISNKIVESLHKRSPLSLVRIGDGEGNAIGMTSEPLHPVQISTFYEKFLTQNGTDIPIEDAVRFCSEISSALTSADIVGIRSFRVDEKSLIEKALARSDGRAALGLLYGREFARRSLTEGRWRRAIVTSAWIHLELIPFLTDIVRAAESIIVVTGRSQLYQVVSSRLGRRLAEFIEVPVQGFMPVNSLRSHYFEAFPAVRRRLSRDLQGQLVLVGAGLFGKIYCRVAKASGAVALDLGSAFDVLAGMTTRPVHQEYNVDALRWM